MIAYDPRAVALTDGKAALALSRIQSNIISQLAVTRGALVLMSSLIEAGELETDKADLAVRDHIKRIRRGVKATFPGQPDPILTRWGQGYAWAGAPLWRREVLIAGRRASHVEAPPDTLQRLAREHGEVVRHMGKGPSGLRLYVCISPAGSYTILTEVPGGVGVVASGTDWRMA